VEVGLVEGDHCVPEASQQIQEANSGSHRSQKGVLLYSEHQPNPETQQEHERPNRKTSGLTALQHHRAISSGSSKMPTEETLRNKDLG